LVESVDVRIFDLCTTSQTTNLKMTWKERRDRVDWRLGFRMRKLMRVYIWLFPKSLRKWR